MTQFVKQAKRSEFTLIIETLQNTTKPIKKTNLLYKTRINFYQLDRYLNFLLSKGLVEYIDEPLDCYRITQKGMRFIEIMNDATISKTLGSLTTKIKKS